MNLLKVSTAATIKLGPFLDENDGKTAETGLTISQADVRLSKNGGNMAQKNSSTACTHDEIGFYDCPIDTTDTNTVGRLLIAVHESGALPVWVEYMVVPAVVYDSLVGGSDYLQVDAVQVEGSDATDQIRDSIVDDATRIDASDLNTEIDALKNGGRLDLLVDAIKAKTDNLPADPASETNVNANETKIDTIDTLIDAITAKLPTNYIMGSSVQTAKDDEIDAILADTNELQGDWTNTGRLDTIIDSILADTNELQTDNTPGSLATIEGKIDTIDGIVDNILTDTGTTLDGKIDTIDTVVDAIKAVTDNLPESGALTTLLSNVSAILTDTGTTLDGKIDTIDTLIDAITAKMPTNYVMGSSVQTDKDDEIDAIKAKTDNLPADPASETNVDANETKIDTLDAVADAIKAKTDNLPTDPADDSDIDAQLATIDANVDAILVDTGTTLDALIDKVIAYIKLLARSDAAIATDLSTELGEINADLGSGAGDFDNTTDSQEALSDGGITTFPSGANEVTITVDDGSDPIEGVEVLISNDADGTNNIWKGTTNSIGVAVDVNEEKPQLDDGTYYVWKYLSGYSFTLPETMVVAG